MPRDLMNDTGTYDSSVLQSLRNFRAGRQFARRQPSGKITLHNVSHIISLTGEYVNFRELDESVCSEELNRSSQLRDNSIASAVKPSHRDLQT